MPDNIKNILLINLTRLGDILQSTPLLKALKQKHPQAQVHYLAVDKFAEVCRYIPEIDQVIPFDFGSAVAIAKEAARDLPRRLQEVDAFVASLHERRFDMVINLSHSRISALFCHLLGVPDTRGLTLDAQGYRQILHPWARHFFTANLNRSFDRFNLVDLYLGLALESDLGRPAEGRLSFKIPATAHSQAAHLLSDWTGKSAKIKIGFQPGASLPSKRWPADSFIALGQLLRDQLDAGIVVLGSRAEEKLADQVATSIGPAALNLAGQTDIGTLGALLQQMDLLVTNDTGTQHVATAVGTRVLSLCFGSALAHETGPYGRGHLVVESTVPCYPCSFHVECPRFRCQEQVQPEAVFRLAQAIVGSEFGFSESRILNPESLLNIWRTDFDADGFWTLRPIQTQPLSAASYLNLISQSIWKRVLSAEISAQVNRSLAPNEMIPELEDYSSPRQPEFESEVQASQAAFSRLHHLAQRGQQICSELLIAAQPPIKDLSKIKSLADSLAGIDGDISSLASQIPVVQNLALDFAWGKENLRGDQVHHLAGQTERLYRRLSEIAQQFQRALSHTDHFIESCRTSHVPSAAN